MQNSKALVLKGGFWYLGIWTYFIFMALILIAIALGRKPMLIGAAGLLAVGSLESHSIFVGVQSVYSAILITAIELLPVILLIGFVSALTKLLQSVGADTLLARPFLRMRHGVSVFFGVGLVAWLLTLFLWPTPAVSLLGAVLVSVLATQKVPPLGLAVCLCVCAEGAGLSGDLVIQEAPGLVARGAGLSIEELLPYTYLLVGACAAVACVIGFWRYRVSARALSLTQPAQEYDSAKEQLARVVTEKGQLGGKTESVNGSAAVKDDDPVNDDASVKDDVPVNGDVLVKDDAPVNGDALVKDDASVNDCTTVGDGAVAETGSNGVDPSRVEALVTSGSGLTQARRRLAMLLLMFIVFAAIIAWILLTGVRGDKAAATVGGASIIILVVGSLLSGPKSSLARFVALIKEGMMFSMGIFAPIVIIAAFFFLGTKLGAKEILEVAGDGYLAQFILQLTSHLPMDPWSALLLVMATGVIGALSGSGFSALPLVGGMAYALAEATSCSVIALAAAGQVTAIWTGALIVPWGFPALAGALTNIDSGRLAKENLWIWAGVLIIAFVISWGRI